MGSYTYVSLMLLSVDAVAMTACYELAYPSAMIDFGSRLKEIITSEEVAPPLDKKL
jgi:hypothetical protein